MSLLDKGAGGIYCSKVNIDDIMVIWLVGPRYAGPGEGLGLGPGVLPTMPPQERYSLLSHEHTSQSFLSSLSMSSTEGICAPEAVRSHRAIGPTPLSTSGGVVPMGQAHLGHV